MIKARQLTREYGPLIAVNNVSFSIERGEIVGLLGHNGAGKTTIMKMITGYLEPSSGCISIDGLDSYIKRSETQKRIGYLPENCPLYPDMTIIDYLHYAAGLRGVPADKMAETISYAINKTKLLEMCMRPVNTLSRGWRQRLGVAQAILGLPSLLILDEPTSGLDPLQIQEMRWLIRELAKTSTVVLSTHIMQEVEAVCDRVLIINRGVVALDSSMKNLQSQGRLLVTTDASPEKCLPIFQKLPGLKLIHNQARDNLHAYTLEAEDKEIQEITPLVARLLFEHELKIYGIQPLVRDLETIFTEIAEGKDVSLPNSKLDPALRQEEELVSVSSSSIEKQNDTAGEEDGKTNG